MGVEIRVLGRVDALVDGRELPLRGSKQRAVLAMLALRANRTVSADELIDGLWGEDPPASAAKNLQLYVSQLRKALGADGAGARIVTHGRGYELQLPEDAVDATKFERLVEEAARVPANAAGTNGAAGAALELWRGAPLADVAVGAGRARAGLRVGLSLRLILRDGPALRSGRGEGAAEGVRAQAVVRADA